MGDERLCVCCPAYHPSGTPRIVRWPQACESCRERLRSDLLEIPMLVALTTERVEKEQAAGQRVSGSRELPSPVNITALGVTEPTYARGLRAEPELDLRHDPGAASDQIGIGQPAATLDQWVTDWIESRDQHENQPVPDLFAIVSWLLNRLDWACDEHPAIDEFAHEIKVMVKALRGITREQTSGASAGKCPAKLRDETRCGTPLTVDPYVDEIQCRRCGTKWQRREAGWFHLRAQQAEWDDNGGEEAA
jgi:hypothetical protein